MHYKKKHPILIFSHIPKSGGTSLRKVVTNQYQENEICQVYQSELNLPAPNHSFISAFKEKQSAYRVVYGHFSFSVHNLLGIPPCYLTVLREPVARVISLFAHYKRGIHSDWYQQIKEGLTLQDMIRKRMAGGVNNHMTRIIAGHPYQPGEVVQDTKFLDRAKSNIEKYYVFSSTTEALQKDVQTLGRLLEWQDVSVPHLNGHPKPHDDINHETLSLILENNQLDIKLYEWVKTQDTAVRPKNLNEKHWVRQ